MPTLTNSNKRILKADPLMAKAYKLELRRSYQTTSDIAYVDLTNCSLQFFVASSNLRAGLNRLSEPAKETEHVSRRFQAALLSRLVPDAYVLILACQHHKKQSRRQEICLVSSSTRSRAKHRSRLRSHRSFSRQ